MLKLRAFLDFVAPRLRTRMSRELTARDNDLTAEVTPSRRKR
jgi:hypothetical protein